MDKQLSLFVNQDSYDLFIEDTPKKLTAIPDGKFIIVTRTIAETGEVKRYTLPIAFKPHEASIVIKEIQGFHWQLDDDGYPVHLYQILDHIRHLIDVEQI